MAIVRLQTGTNKSGGAAFNVTLAATTPGNFLVTLYANRGDVPTTGPTSTHGTWTKVASRYFNAGAEQVSVEIWIVPNLTGTSTTVSFPNTGQKQAAIIHEYSGVGKTQHDRNASAQGTGTALDSGTTATTQKGYELWLGDIGVATGGRIISAPTNGFTLTHYFESGGGGGEIGMVSLEKIVTAVGAANVGATLSVADNWAGAIATFYGVEIENLIGTVTAQGDISGALRRRRGITATVPATSALSATLDRVRPVAATVPATSTVSGSLAALTGLAATVATTSTVSGVPARYRRIVGSVTAASLVSADLARTNQLITYIVASSSVTADGQRVRPLATVIAATSTVTPGLATNRPLSSWIGVTSYAEADLFVINPDLKVTAISLPVYEASGGDYFEMSGSFPINTPIRVYFGTILEPRLARVYSGIPGQGHDLYAVRIGVLGGYMPLLPPGTYNLLIDDGTNQDLLLNAVTVYPAQGRNLVYTLRNLLPPLWDVGPRSFEVDL